MTRPNGFFITSNHTPTTGYSVSEGSHTSPVRGTRSRNSPYLLDFRLSLHRKSHDPVVPGIDGLGLLEHVRSSLLNGVTQRREVPT